MKPNFIRAVLLFLAAQTFVLASGFMMFSMIGEVNRRQTDQHRISYLFGHFGKYVRVLREYHRLYPTGRLGVYFKISLALGLALFVASAWQLGLFG